MENWIKVTEIENIPSMGSRKVLIDEHEIAIFKTRDGSIFAIENECPHKHGKLSEGLVHGHKVTCPLHNWNIDLENGDAIGEEVTCAITYDTMVEKDILFIKV